MTRFSPFLMAFQECSDPGGVKQITLLEGGGKEEEEEEEKEEEEGTLASSVLLRSSM